MNKIIFGFGLFLVLSGGNTGVLMASDISTSTQDETPVSTITPSIPETNTVPIPLVLKDTEKIFDSESHSIPPAPGKNAEGNPIHSESNGQIPRGDLMNNLSDPSFLPQIESFNKSENKPRVYYWHSLKGLDYCHFRSGAGSHWYGWGSDVHFIWALYRAGHFWWHDDYAGRWLYFDRGYWRWQGPQKSQFQVYLENGHYYACDAKGNLGDDLFTTGTEEAVTEPVFKETVVPLNKQDDTKTSGNHGFDTFNHVGQ